MLKFLQQLLQNDAGRAPVLIRFMGPAAVHRSTLYAVDATGAVFALDKDPTVTYAYPWHTIAFISPQKAKG